MGQGDRLHLTSADLGPTAHAGTKACVADRVAHAQPPLDRSGRDPFELALRIELPNDRLSSAGGDRRIGLPHRLFDLVLMGQVGRHSALLQIGQRLFQASPDRPRQLLAVMALQEPLGLLGEFSSSESKLTSWTERDSLRSRSR